MGERQQRYSRAEVAARDGRGGSPVWMIYKDVVYDVTSYIAEHPGGDVILDEAGADATKAFDEVGHSADSRVILAKYRIGEIIEEEKLYDENGKKKKRVVSQQPETNNKSCLSAVTCGLLG
ncbi:cytochrome b5-like [Battus philenor]|uniref:cytochrome b5-like n=1 Tax=Battus philenor TaxID=42288 RepID=UPI0035D082AA